jgi:TPR repeat protein
MNAKAAHSSLGYAYYNGQGVPQNYAEAYFWLDIAASSKLEDSLMKHLRQDRDDATSNLTKTVLLQAQERARKWFEGRPVQTNPQ